MTYNYLTVYLFWPWVYSVLEYTTHESIHNGSLILLAVLEQPGQHKIIFTKSKLIKEELPLMGQSPGLMQNKQAPQPHCNQVNDIR